MCDSVCKICGGCPLRNLDENLYRKEKLDKFLSIISSVKQSYTILDEPIFISDGKRRRTDMSFISNKKETILGFNEANTHNLVDINNCLMLDSRLSSALPILHQFLKEFSSIAITTKNKKKIEIKYITKGSMYMLLADNGIDITLKLMDTPTLEHRMYIAEFAQSVSSIIRISWQINNSLPETIIEKQSPELYISGYTIDIPQGVFLQASKEAETKMIEKVMEYMGETSGKIADLFCGLGTFSYPLAKNIKNEILSIDLSSLSTEGLKKAINRNQIHNIKVINKNLFKYPLDELDFKDIKAVVIDPPRAGAHEQCREIVKLPKEYCPKKIVFVSCNPETFIYDAKLLIDKGYKFEKVTLIDQFVYSKHQELIALFTYNHD